ncbi:MAG: hypothetical protein IH822_04795 [Chloroflexi bacterium]|nr:hypothetical protein [Chloroflexota bacterium]
MAGKRSKRKHEDTSISLHPLTIDEALKKAMDAGPLPKKKAEDTKPSAPLPSQTIIEALAIGNHPADS